MNSQPRLLLIMELGVSGSTTLLSWDCRVQSHSLSCVFYVFPVQVCKRMDMICQRVLNQGFLKVERYHSLCQRQVKAQLPRSVTTAAQIMN